LQEKLAEWIDEFEVEQELAGLQMAANSNDVDIKGVVDEQ
jgi:hypothetical protein